MPRLLIRPEPAGTGGPHVFLRRLIPQLEVRGYRITRRYWHPWDLALVNLGGLKSLAIAARRRPFAFRAAGYYIKDIFLRHQRPWTWQYDFYNWQTRLFLRRAGRVIFQSEYAQNVLIKETPQVQSLSQIIFNGVDLNQFKPGQTQNHEIPVLGVAGILRHERLQELISVSAALGFPHTLLVVGIVEAEQKKALENHAARLGVELFCPGAVRPEKLPEFYQQMDVFVHTTAADICPNVVAEALACGVPVVCHGYGGARELVGAAGIAITGTPYPAEEGFIIAVADAVRQVWENHREYREKARAQAEAHLDIRLTGAKYAAVLNELIAE